MTDPRTVRCPCCDGTGRAGTEAGGRGPSKEALLRAELVRVWDVAGSLERFAAGAYETAGAAIAGLVTDLEDARNGIAERDRRIADLERQLAVHEGWGRDGTVDGTADGSGDGSAKPTMTRADHRLASARFEAAKGGGDPDAIRKRKLGAQPGHRGSARRGPADRTVEFRPELCGLCGRADLKIARIVRKMVGDLAEARRRTVLMMYVIRIGRCPGCGALTAPHTDAISGTSFGPLLRATLQAFERAHNTEDDMRLMLREIEGASFSIGAISNCMTAMADHIDGPVLAVPDEEPMVMDGAGLRGYSSPVEPPSNIPDTEYRRQDAALTRLSSLWTSFMPQPASVRIVERASMDPHVRTDETSHQVGSDRVQASVAETTRTAQVRVVPHRDASTLRDIWGWMEDRPAMRDGTTGYEWHMGILSRCLIHLLRDAEKSSMEHDLGSPQYDRHQMLRAVYRDAKLAGWQVERLAGGPVRCASHLGLVDRVPGLAAFADGQIGRLAGRVRMIIESFPADSVATTLSNAVGNMFAAVRIPGMPLHNNGTERTIRDMLVVDRRRIRFPDWRAARNFSVLRTFAATCEKNGMSAYQATARMAQDPTWDIFTDGIPPPILSCGGATPADDRAASAAPARVRPRLQP